MIAVICFLCLIQSCLCQLSVHAKHLSLENLFTFLKLYYSRSVSYCIRNVLICLCVAIWLYADQLSPLLPFSFLFFFLPIDLTELQVAVSDVNGRYETLGGELKERLSRQQASLELRQKARQGTDELKSWLADKEHSLKQGQTASPSKPEVVRAQAQENKVKEWFHLFCMLRLGWPLKSVKSVDNCSIYCVLDLLNRYCIFKLLL